MLFDASRLMLFDIVNFQTISNYVKQINKKGELDARPYH